MHSHEHGGRRLAMTLALLLSPLAGVQAARLLGQSAPATANATPMRELMPSLDAAAALPPISAARALVQRNALAHRASADPVSMNRSPMAHPEPAPETNELSDQLAEVPIPSPEPMEPTPSFVLNAVLRGDGVAVASINGEMHQLGEVVSNRGGWTLIAIDGKSRSVTLRSSKGATLTLTSPIR